MAERTLRIFISSPGDVGEERVIAGRVVERLAGEFGQSLDLEAVLWEHEPLRATGHFQEQIVVPSETDIVVCILWSRLGTRLPEGFARDDGTPYASGTEWEFEDALRSYRERGTPDLLVYRKTREAVSSMSDKQEYFKRFEQKEALDAFIERWFGSAEDSFKAAFHAFETGDEFESLLEVHLRKLIAEHLPEHLTAAEGDAARISWHKGSPFRGLEAFDFEHAPVFFGRTRAVGEVKQAIEGQAARGTAFLIVFGMSGSGKSSLIRAGLLPTISQPGVVERIGLWRWSTFRPSDATGDLFDGLAQALLSDTALPELTGLKWDRDRLAEQFRSAPGLAAQPIEQALAAASQDEALTTGAESRLALVIDQMEELFTLERVDDAERAAFIGVLASLAKSGLVWVIGAMRSDFYHRCAEAPELVALCEGAGQYHLVPPSAAEIAQIIRNPARAAGLRFEVAAETGERLDDVLHAAAARHPAALPLLEFTLEELFKLRSSDGVLTYDAYERLGGLEGALARRAEEVLTSLEASVQAALPAVLRALVTVGADEEEPAAARRVPLDAVATTPERKALVDAFVEARLLVTDRADDGTAVVRVAHEALLTNWPRLQAWLDEDREFLRSRTRVAMAAAHWHQEGDSPDLLLPEGKLLAEAKILLERREEIETYITVYIEASLAAHQRQLDAAIATHRRRHRIAAGSAVVFALLAIVAGILGYLAYAKSIDAEHEKAIADSERNNALRTQSLFLSDLSLQQTADGYTENGILLGLEALPDDIGNPNRPYDVRAEAALYNAVLAHRELAVFSGHEGVVSRADFSPIGDRIVTASLDQTARIWDALSGRQIVTLTGHTDWVTDAQFSPDGSRVVTASYDKTIRIWDAESGTVLQVLRGHEDRVWSARISSDGRRILSASSDGTARLWDTESAALIAVFAGHNDVVWEASFNFDDSRVVTASSDGTARLWDVAAAQTLAVLRGHEDDVLHAEFNPNGERVVTSSSDGTARVWEVSTGTEIDVLRGHSGLVFPAIYSPDGRHIVTASEDGLARVWNAMRSDGKVTLLSGHEDSIWNAAYSPDMRRLVTVSGDQTARLWNAATGANIAILRGHVDDVYYAEFSPKGHRLVTASADQTARLWNATTDGQLATLQGHSQYVWHAAFGPLGRRIITTSSDRTARLWNAATGAEIAVLRGHEGAVLYAEFNREGDRVVTASADGTSRVWDVQQNAEVAILSGHNEQVNHATFSPNGELIATVSDDMTARLWDASSATQIYVLRGHGAGVLFAMFDTEGRRLVTASRDGTARLWDVTTGTEITVFDGHEGVVNDVAFNPDGSRIVTASWDGTARIWDVETGRELAILRGHEGPINSVVYSPDGQWILTNSEDFTARLWSAANGAAGPVMRGHEGRVIFADFSPDGLRIITASADRTARLWDAVSGAEIATMRGHGSAVWHAAMNPAGTRIVTASLDRTARLWRSFPSTKALIDYAWCTISRRLTKEERVRFFLDPEPSSGARPPSDLDCDEITQ